MDAAIISVLVAGWLGMAVGMMLGSALTVLLMRCRRRGGNKNHVVPMRVVGGDPPRRA